MFFARLIPLPHALTDISLVVAIGEYISLAKANLSNVSSLIKIKKTVFSGFTHYTITLRVPKGQFEDDVYAKHYVLLDIVPRAYTIITSGSGADEKIVSFVTGPRKFSGKTAADEDPDGNDENFKDTGIYDHSTVISWARDDMLKITSSEKANGKFACCRLFDYDDCRYITFGSKNYHITIPLDSLNDWLSDETNDTADNAIVYSIAKDIYDNIHRIIMLMPTFNAGYTLCGEYCDGQHFVLGNNTIEWFGFFRFGECLDTHSATMLLADAGLKTVSSRVVFQPGDDITNIDTIIKMSRCVQTEGAVLYFENMETEDIILCKTKSIRYILMRMLRQAIINRGYMGINHFIKRIIDASDYHGLNTSAAIRISKQLIRFVFWMLEHKIPTNVLGIIPVVSVRGKLPTGFAIWWNQYLITTSTPDIDVTPDDFGDFDKVVFQAAMDTHMKTGIRTNGDPNHIIFIQDIQGGGKSTTAAAIQGPDPIGDTRNEGACQFPVNLVPHNFGSSDDYPSMLLTNLDTEYVEQDMFYGHSPSCLAWLYYKTLYASGPRVIIVSRCNANEKHYKKYIDTLAPMPTMIYFIAPERVDYVSVITSMAGIIERSTNGDKLMVGRQEYDIDKVLEIITRTYKDFKINDNAIRYNRFNDIPEDILREMKAAVDNKNIIEYVTWNFDMILALRRPLADIVADMTSIITRIQDGEFLEKVYHSPRPTYVGLCVNPDDASSLRVETDIEGTHYNHHTTQFHHGQGKRWKASPFDTVSHGDIINAMITHRVTQKSSGAIAYRIDLMGVRCANPTPHITSFMPIGMKPAEANNFVGLSDETVNVEVLREPIVLTLTSKWF
tara:strand:+ start:4358 stop:6877 length:2520 start_codon:yes stop_codon:yes gene_type:complete